MNISRNSPIAVLDSGIGGISLLKNLAKKYPNENYIYLADNAYMPYGNKSKRAIQGRVEQLINYLYNNFNIKQAILACNTASISALEYLKGRAPVPVLGLNLEIYSKDDYTTLCTELTSKNYKELNTVACPRLARDIEQNIFDKSTLKRKIKSVLDKANIAQNNIVLGCTHYELVANIFNELSDKNFVLPCKNLIENLHIDKPNLDRKGDILMLATLPTKSYIDKLWKVFNM